MNVIRRSVAAQTECKWLQNGSLLYSRRKMIVRGWESSLVWWKGTNSLNHVTGWKFARVAHIGPQRWKHPLVCVHSTSVHVFTHFHLNALICSMIFSPSSSSFLTHAWVYGVQYFIHFQWSSSTFWSFKEGISFSKGSRNCCRPGKRRQ